MIDLHLLALALIVGAANWAFRYLPMRLPVRQGGTGGLLSRFLAATGPAAIGTLFVASVLPMLGRGSDGPLLAGTAAVIGVFAASRSVVGATLAGSVAYGAAFALLAG
jgi:branched-subunit amino acid transport protein